MNRDKMLLHGAKYGDRAEELVIDAWLTFLNIYSKLNTVVNKKICDIRAIIIVY